jgi:hypothetical protein
MAPRVVFLSCQTGSDARRNRGAAPSGSPQLGKLPPLGHLAWLPMANVVPRRPSACEEHRLACFDFGQCDASRPIGSAFFLIVTTERVSIFPNPIFTELGAVRVAGPRYFRMCGGVVGGAHVGDWQAGDEPSGRCRSDWGTRTWKRRWWTRMCSTRAAAGSSARWTGWSGADGGYRDSLRHGAGSVAVVSQTDGDR